MLRIALYTHHALFEPALSLVDALAPHAEVHLLLEVPPREWRTASFEAAPGPVPTGLVDADPLLSPFYPAPVRAMWRKAASFHLVSHGERRSRDPRSLRVTLQVLRWLRRLRPDVLHVDDVDVSPRLALGLALTSPPYPVLLGCHDPEPHSGERRWAMKRLTRALAFPAAAAVLVHHRSGKEALLRRHPRLRLPVHVVRLAAYTFIRGLEPNHEQPVDAAPTVLLFGRITPYKGLEDLFRVAPSVAVEVPGVRFVVAGRPVAGYTPPAPPEVGPGATVECRYDYIPNTEIGKLFRGASVTVCPYTDASQSGVVLTAFAFGCPVVVTDVGGLAEYVEHGRTGLVVAPGDHEELAAVLVRCLRDHDLAARMRAGVAAATAGDLGWARAAAEMVTVYHAVLDDARGRRVRRARNR
ncbi:MAG TPA: glycosyltransferase family 4 protein [Nocardioidaceae bacterium]|nr:glycosyltransferase family 4 protein [Nocardioidaceae bacterium]